MSNNPLQQFFRQPAIYIKLPSNGKFYPEGALIMPENGEIPVYPMTAVDEITYRTPDALFNGTAVVNVIQSCVPAIKNAWFIPAMDIDTLLVSIRIASYGHALDLDSTCPACNTDAELSLDLRTVLDTIRPGQYSEPIRHRDLEIYLKPMTYRSLNDNNSMQFEEQRVLQMLPGSDLPDEEKVTRLGDALKKITSITVKALADSIAAVKTPDSLVTDRAFIEEFLQNCDRSLFGNIRKQIVDLKLSGELKPMNIKCNDCGHDYQQPFTLDMVSFFEVAS